MEDIFLPFKKGGMNDIDLGEPTASQPETSSQESSSTDINSASTQVMCTFCLICTITCHLSFVVVVVVVVSVFITFEHCQNSMKDQPMNILCRKELLQGYLLVSTQMWGDCS